MESNQSVSVSGRQQPYNGVHVKELVRWIVGRISPTLVRLVANNLSSLSCFSYSWCSSSKSSMHVSDKDLQSKNDILTH